MAQHIRYITRRSNGVYYYQRRVPKSVIDDPKVFAEQFERRHYFRKSLGTRRQGDALSTGVHVHRWFEEQLRLVGGENICSSLPGFATRPLTPALLSKVTAEIRDREVRPWARQIVLAEQGEEFHDELARMVQQRDLDGSELRATLRDYGVSDDPRMPNVQAATQSLIERERLDAPLGSNARALIARAIREGLIAAHANIDAMLSGEMPAIPPTPVKRSSVPTITAVVEEYARQKTAGRTVREVRTAVKSFVQAAGDLPLDEITRSHFIIFCEAEGRRIVGGRSRGSIQRPMSPATLQKKIRLLHSAIEKAIAHGRFAGPNPASKIDVTQFTMPVPKAKMPDKRPFDVHEINLILHYPWFTGCESAARIHQHGGHRLSGVHFWAPILALYSGCRAGELGGLMVNEIMLDHQYPHILIRDNAYRTTKGSYRRKVPVLDVLMQLGFRKFVEKIASEGHDRLFPDWKPPRVLGDAGAPAWSNGSMIRSFNRTVIPNSLRTILNPEARQEVTFHGFRGAFKTLLGLREYGIPENYKHEVIGHAKSNLDKRYVVEIPLEETYPAVRACNYQGIMLPAAPTC